MKSTYSTAMYTPFPVPVHAPYGRSYSFCIYLDIGGSDWISTKAYQQLFRHHSGMGTAAATQSTVIL